jgi:hypothetical protein
MTDTLPNQPDENAPERPPSAYVLFSNSESSVEPPALGRVMAHLLQLC